MTRREVSTEEMEAMEKLSPSSVLTAYNIVGAVLAIPASFFQHEEVAPGF